MFLQELSCLRNESFDHLFLFFFSLLMSTARVKVAQLLAHLSEKSILESLQLAQAEHLAALSTCSSIFSWTLDEVQDITFFFLSDFTLSYIFENTAK